jgi:hypothetical protein
MIIFTSCESYQTEVIKKTCVSGHWEDEIEFVVPTTFPGGQLDKYVCDSAKIDTVLVTKYRLK